MFQIDAFQVGRVSWYYEAVYGTEGIRDLGYQHFTPKDLGARWISKHSHWSKDSQVVALGGIGTGFDKCLRDEGINVVAQGEQIGDYVSGAYLIADANTAWDLLKGGAFDQLYRSLFPFGKVLLAIEMSFASNSGFDHVSTLASDEASWLALSADRFSNECGNLPVTIILESPAVMARVILNRMQTHTGPGFTDCTLARFVFDPDVMTSPVGERVVDLADAQRLQGPSGEKSERFGVMLLSLSRTDKT